MNKALLLIDFQYDFFPGGMNTIERSESILTDISLLLEQFELIYATQLWHPPTHIYFASNHLWRRPNQEIEINGQKVVLQNMHCVAESFGADLRDELDRSKISSIFKRGTKQDTLPFSVFSDFNEKGNTGLLEALQDQEVSHLFLAGINSNNVVLNSVKQARAAGIEVSIIPDFTAGLNENDLGALQKIDVKIKPFR